MRRGRSAAVLLLVTWLGLGGGDALLAQEPTDQPATPPQAPAPTPKADGLDALRAAHRSAKTAILMSFPVPGWGQLYADTPFWSVVGFAVQMYYLGNILMERRRVERQRVVRDRTPTGSARDLQDKLVTEHGERVRDYIWWSAGGYLILSLDAYVSVELADFDSDTPPTPDLQRDWEREIHEDGGDGGGMALQLNFRF